MSGYRIASVFKKAGKHNVAFVLLDQAQKAWTADIWKQAWIH